MKFVGITWNDAHHHAPGTWVALDGLKIGCRVVTTGFLVSKRHRHYTVAQSIEPDGQATGVFSIPRSAVERFKVVR